VKVKVALERFMKVKSKILLFFNLGWDWVIYITPRLTYSWVRGQVLIIQEGEWACMCR